jgi:GT2 family glycosyltransferase
MPSISIIVPVFNGIRYLPYFLKSLAEAAPSHAELIVVDDGSTEPVLEAVPSDFPVASVIKLRNERNQGYSAAVNRGFGCATGDIVVQLNTDLVLDHRCIASMIELIEVTPKAGVVGSKQIFPTSGALRHIGMAFGTRRYCHVFSGLPADHPLCCKTRTMQVVSGATVAMSRRVLAEIGPLDERYYNTHENTDHCLKAHARGYENYTCAESIAYHWVSQSGPARFARVEEDDALFWGEWTAARTIDLDRFVDESLDYILNSDPELLHYGFEPLSLCRSNDESLLLERLERRWKGAGAKTHHTRVFNSSSADLWLPMELPHRAMINPAPYVYLVDHISQLSENSLWFNVRRRIVRSEIVMDTNGVVLTTDDLLDLYGTRSR